MRDTKVRVQKISDTHLFPHNMKTNKYSWE